MGGKGWMVEKLRILRGVACRRMDGASILDATRDIGV